VTPGQAGTLAGALDASGTLVRFDPVLQAALCAQLAAPASVVLTIFNAAHNEAVLATGCVTQGGLQYVQVQRAWSGSSSRAWPLDTCVCVGAVRLGLVCPDPADTGCCPAPLAGVDAAGCIEIDRTNPAAPIIRLPASGVVPGDYCGLKVNACGLITSIDEHWPASCLPAFNPCSNCGAGGTSAPGTGAANASAVAYNPRTGAAFALGTNAQTTIDQLDAALAHCCGSTVATISTGQGLALSGSPTDPTVGHSPSALPAGVYGGFTTDSLGHLVAYAPPAPPLSTQHISQSPGLFINAANNGTTFQYVLLPASTGSAGAVQLASVSDVQNITNLNSVLTVGTAQAAVNKYAPTYTAGTGISISGTTLNLDLCAVPSALVMAETDMLLMCNGTSPRKITKVDLSREIGTFAAARFDSAAGAMPASRNVQSLTVVAPGQYRVQLDASVLTVPLHYAVSITMHDNPAYRRVTYSTVTPTSFDIFVRDSTGTLVADSFDFFCVGLN
jgi:hypothetical protein